MTVKKTSITESDPKSDVKPKSTKTRQPARATKAKKKEAAKPAAKAKPASQTPEARRLARMAALASKLGEDSPQENPAQTEPEKVVEQKPKVKPPIERKRITSEDITRAAALHRAEVLEDLQELEKDLQQEDNKEIVYEPVNNLIIEELPEEVTPEILKTVKDPEPEPVSAVDVVEPEVAQTVEESKLEPEPTPEPVVEEKLEVDESPFNFMEGTLDEVKQALLEAYDNRFRIRVWYGDTQSGAAAPLEYDLVGTVGRSSGENKIPLLIASSRSSGGVAIRTNNILRMDTNTGKTLYKHPNFTAGKWAIVEPTTPEYKAAVTFNGKIHTQFYTQNAASCYVAFMLGDRFKK